MDIELTAALLGADLHHALGHFLAEPFEKFKLVRFRRAHVLNRKLID